MTAIRGFLSELKRRKVYQVAAAYVAVAVAISVSIPDLFAVFGLPTTAARFVLLLLVLGFPFALALAWVFEVRPEQPLGGQVAPQLGVPGDAQSRVGSEGPVGDAAFVPPAAVSAADPHDPRPSLAVLPFASFSDDHETDYFGLGVMEDVLSRLAHVKGIRLISRTSCMRYRAAEKCTRDIARELGVRAILEGSVRRSDGRVRVVAQLIDGESDEHLWADTYDRELADVFSVQTEIAERIATALSAELSEEERARVRTIPTKHLGAWNLYLQAAQIFQTQGPEELARAVELGEEAVRLDPTFALAWAHLAFLLTICGTNSDLPAWDVWLRIRHAAERALALDPWCGEAHGALAVYRFFHEWDPEGAHTELDRARALNPEASHLMDWKALLLAFSGRPEEAVAMARQSLAADPLSATGHIVMGIVLVLIGRLGEAEESLNDAARHWPHSPNVRRWLGTALFTAGRPAEALVQFEMCAELGRHVPAFEVYRGLPLVFLGRREEARRIFEELVARSESEWVEPFTLFMLGLALDGPDAAWPYFEQAAEIRSFWLPYGMMSPRFRPLLADPRYRAVAERVVPGVLMEA